MALLRRQQAAPGPATGLWRTTSAIVVCKVITNAAVASVVLVTARQLGPSGRGVLVLLLTLASFTLLLCSAGLNVSGRIHLVGERPVESTAYLGLAAVLTLLQVVLCGGLGAVLLPLVDVELSLFQTVLFSVLGGSLLLPFLLNAAINAYGLTTRAAVVEASGGVAQLVFALALAVQGVETVTPYLAAFIAGYVVQVGVGAAALRRAGVPLGLRYRPDQWKALVRTGLPSVPMDLSQVLTLRLDRWVVGLFLGPAAVGVYSVAATAPELLRLPALALSQPIFHRLASGAARIADFSRIRRLALGLTAALGVVCFAAAPWAIRTLLGDAFLGAVTPLRILLLAEFGITLFYIDGALLAAGLKRVADASRAAVAGLAVAIVAYFVLVPAYGLAGAAWSSVGAYLVVGLTAHGLLRYRDRPGGGTVTPVSEPSQTRLA